MSVVAVTTRNNAKRAALLFEDVLVVAHAPGEWQSELPDWMQYLYVFPLPLFFDMTRSFHPRAESVYIGPELNPTVNPASGAVGYIAALENMPVIEDNSTSWKQIEDFRRDNEAKGRYRRLRVWLHESTSCSTIEQASEVLAQRLDDYEWAVKKHGLATMSQAFCQVFDPKTIVSAASGGTIASLLGTPWLGLLAGGLVISGKALAFVGERIIAKQDIERGSGSEVGLLYEANKKFHARNK